MGSEIKLCLVSENFPTYFSSNNLFCQNYGLSNLNTFSVGN